MNLVYLACKVLVLLDIGYPGRFWCLFESWLALQRGTEHGLESAVKSIPFSKETSQYGRAFFINLHLATDATRQQVIEMLGNAEPDDVFTLLSSPDVRVTNQSDKDEKIKEVMLLSDLVKRTLSASSSASSVSVQ